VTLLKSIPYAGSHNLQNTKAIGFSPGWHTQNRNKRGRGPRAKYENIGVVTLGPQGKLARAYLKGVQKHVGWARAGWNAGIGFWNVKGQWISRHGMGAGFKVVNNTPGNEYVHVGNTTSWAKRSQEGERILRNAMSARARDMEAYFFRMMKLAASKATKGAAA